MLSRLAIVFSVLCNCYLPNLCLAQDQSPFEFVQRRDVGQEINIRPQQLELVQRLEPICDAQCQARVMDLLMNAPSNIQSQFMAQSEAERAQTAAVLDRSARESIETEMLSQNVLNDPQMDRFLELRTQFLGNDSFLSDRVSSLLGLSNDQITQLRAVQDAGTGLLDACQAIPGLTPTEMQQGMNLIQNNLIDQSINILNGAQIEIYLNLCGTPCEFDLPGESPTDPSDEPTDPTTEPTDPTADPSDPTSPDSGGSDTRTSPVEVQPSGSGTRTTPVQRSSPNTRNGNVTRNIGSNTRTNRVQRNSNPRRTTQQPSRRNSNAPSTTPRRTSPNRGGNQGSSSRN